MSAQKTITLGTPVTKGPLSLPATTTANLFTVSGPVLITGLVGIVTTAIQNQACTLALGVTGSNTAIATALAITNGAVNTTYLPVNNAGAGGTPLFSISPFVAFQFEDRLNAFICAAANITWTTSATNTGAMTWNLWYIPLAGGAKVT